MLVSKKSATDIKVGLFYALDQDGDILRESADMSVERSKEKEHWRSNKNKGRYPKYDALPPAVPMGNTLLQRTVTQSGRMLAD